MLDMFDGVEKTDLQYLINGFKKSPSLVPWVASLMRDGQLLKALSIKTEGAQPMALGKKMAGKFKRFRNLPRRFWELTWVNLKIAPADAFVEKENKFILEVHQALAEWIFRLMMDALLPSQHKAAQYEGPLIAVLLSRNKAVGSRCADLSLARIKQGIFGYFYIPPDFATTGEIIVQGGKGMKIKVVAVEIAESVDDWIIEENTNFDCRLVSPQLQFGQGLFCLLFTQHPETKKLYPEHDDAFEFPNAADGFPDPKAYSAAAMIQGEETPSSGSASSPDGTVTVTPIKRRRPLFDSPSALPLTNA